MLRGTKRARPGLPLHGAVARYDLASMERLIAAGAPLTEIDDEDGSTPLHLAVDGPDEAVHAMLAILLTADEDDRAEALCAHNDDGLTPLQVAARCSSRKAVEMILDSIDEEIRQDVIEMRSHRKGNLFNGNWGKKATDGALEELDIEHMTLLQCAVERLDPKTDEQDDEDGDISMSLSDDGRNLNTAIEMIKMLIERGANVNVRDAEGRTPLHQAVEYGVQPVAELLLSAGADPTLGCKAIGMANTTLHQAVMRGDESMVRLLVRASHSAALGQLNVDAPGQNGLTPLCLAARSNKEACAKALLEGGADPNAKAAFGKSALDIAKANKRAGILKLFGAECTGGGATAAPFQSCGVRRAAI